MTKIQAPRFKLVPMSATYSLETNVSRVDIDRRQIGQQFHKFILIIQQNHVGGHTIEGWPTGVQFIGAAQLNPIPGSQTVYQWFTNDWGINWAVEVHAIGPAPATEASSINVDDSQFNVVSGGDLQTVLQSIDQSLGGGSSPVPSDAPQGSVNELQLKSSDTSLGASSLHRNSNQELEFRNTVDQSTSIVISSGWSNSLSRRTAGLSINPGTSNTRSHAKLSVNSFGAVSSLSGMDIVLQPSINGGIKLDPLISLGTRANDFYRGTRNSVHLTAKGTDACNFSSNGRIEGANSIGFGAQATDNRNDNTLALSGHEGPYSTSGMMQTHRANIEGFGTVVFGGLRIKNGSVSLSEAATADVNGMAIASYFIVAHIQAYNLDSYADNNGTMLDYLSGTLTFSVHQVRNNTPRIVGATWNPHRATGHFSGSAVSAIMTSTINVEIVPGNAAGLADYGYSASVCFYINFLQTQM